MHSFHILTRGMYCNKNTPNTHTSLSSLPVSSKIVRYRKNLLVNKKKEKRNDVTQIYCHCCTLSPLISLLRPVLLEAVTAAQTAAGQAAIMGYLNFDEEYDFRLQERYLLAAAFSTHPTENLVKDMFVSVYFGTYVLTC